MKGCHGNEIHNVEYVDGKSVLKSIDIFNDAGKLIQKKHFYPSGALKRETEYNGEDRHGKCIDYREDGARTFVSVYEYDELQSVTIENTTQL